MGQTNVVHVNEAHRSDLTRHANGGNPSPKCWLHPGWVCSWVFIFLFVFGGCFLCSIALLHYVGLKQISDQHYCNCPEENRECPEADKECGSVSGDTYAAMYLGLGLAISAFAIIVACC